MFDYYLDDNEYTDADRIQLAREHGPYSHMGTVTFDKGVKSIQRATAHKILRLGIPPTRNDEELR